MRTSIINKRAFRERVLARKRTVLLWLAMSSEEIRDAAVRAAVAIVLQRRRAAVGAVLLAGRTGQGGGQGPQGPKRVKKAFTWAGHMDLLSATDFRLRYRLTPEAFYDLRDQLSPLLDYTSPRARRNARNGNCGSEIEPATRLACALRLMAGASSHDLHLIYNMGRTACYDCLWLVVDAVHAKFRMDFPTEDVAKLEVLEAEFRAKSRRQVWRGCVSAVDGVHFKMDKVNLKDCDNPARFWVERKQMTALLCIAACDARRRFTMYDMSQAATTHDSQAWKASKVGMEVLAGKLPPQFFFNGDTAFTLSKQMIIPTAGKDDNFDFEQSSNRIAIECAFGILIRRWCTCVHVCCMHCVHFTLTMMLPLLAGGVSSGDPWE